MFQGVDYGNTNTIFQKIIIIKIFHHNNFCIIVDSFDILATLATLATLVVRHLEVYLIQAFTISLFYSYWKLIIDGMICYILN